MRFSQSYEDLKTCLQPITSSGEWFVINSNQIQFRHQRGGVMNWYPSTGSLNFQGKAAAADELQRQVARLIGDLTSGDQTNVETSEITLGEGKAERIGTGGISQTYSPPDVRAQEAISAKTVLGHKYSDSELVIGLVGAVGAELKKVEEIIRDRLKVFQYNVEEIRISKDVIPRVIASPAELINDEYIESIAL